MKKWYWFLLSIIIIVFDQCTKQWALMTLPPYQAEAIGPMLNFTLAYNTGAAFSFLNGSGSWHRWFFASFSLLMSGIITAWIIRSSVYARLQQLGLALILGGALGNLVDRARLGYVIDFIEVYYKNYHWPIFNVADSAICVGAALLLIDLYKNPRT